MTAKKITAILLALCLLASTAAASAQSVSQRGQAGTSYYVDNLNPNKSDANLGTDPSAPWESLNRVLLQELQPGDKVYLKRGCIWNEPLLLDENHPTGEILIDGATWGAESEPCAVINGGNSCAVTNVSDEETESFYAVGGWHLYGLELRSSRSNPPPYVYGVGSSGIYLMGSAQKQVVNFTVEHCAIPEATLNGIKLESTATAAEVAESCSFNNIAIQNCRISAAADAAMVEGIYTCFSSGVQGYSVNHFQNVLIEDSEICGTLWDGISVIGGKHVTIRRNQVHDCGRMSPNYWGSGSYGIRTTYAAEVLIEENLIWNQGPSGASGDGGGIVIDNGTKDSIVQYNTTWHNFGPNAIASGAFWNGTYEGSTQNIIYRFNYSYDDGYGWGGALDMTDENEDREHAASTVSNCYLYNNTIVKRGGAAGYGAIFLRLKKAGTTGNVIANNLITVEEADRDFPVYRSYFTGIGSHIAFRNNLYWHASGEPVFFELGRYYDGSGRDYKLDFHSWEAYCGGLNNTVADPELVNALSIPAVNPVSVTNGNIHLRAASPCALAGMDISAYLLPGETASQLKSYYNGNWGKDDDGLLGSQYPIGAAVVEAVPTPYPSVEYQSETGWSLIQGSNQWRYLYSVDQGESFGEMVRLDVDRNCWNIPREVVQDSSNIEQVNMRPDRIGNTSCWTARVWVAPYSGTVSLSSQVNNREVNACSNGFAIIRHNQTQLWSQELPETSTDIYSAQLPTFEVSAGDRIYFMIAGDTILNEVSWRAAITFTRNGTAE